MASQNCGASLAIAIHRLSRLLSSLEDAPNLDCVALDEEGETLFWKDILGEDDPGSEPPDAGETGIVFYTIGTTGAPEGIPLGHRNIHFQLETMVRSGLIEPDDRVLLPLLLHHVYPLVIGTLAPLALRTPVILPDSLPGSVLSRA